LSILKKRGVCSILQLFADIDKYLQKGDNKRMAKKRFGDRRDGALLRNIDPMHIFTPHMFPNRCDNEAFMSETIDLTRINQYLAEKNATNPEYEYKFFQIIVTAMLKVLTLRPKMNYFIANNKLYSRNFVSASFIIKKIFSDKGEEGIAIVKANGEDNLETVREKIYKQITSVRGDKLDSASENMDILGKLPRGIISIMMWFFRAFDKRGWLPESLIGGDPYQHSVLLSNLGSLHLHSGYHHLSNWGTTSIFVIVGDIKKRPFFEEDGTFSMRDSVELGLTVDERIADGYYFAKSIRLLKKLLENPELLEKPFSEEVEIQ